MKQKAETSYVSRRRNCVYRKNIVVTLENYSVL